MVRLVAPLALVAATLIETFAYPDNPEIGQIDAAWWLAGGLLVAALLVRHRWPAPALGLALAAGFAHVAVLGAPVRPLDFAVPITLYTLAAHARTRWLPLAGLGTALVSVLFGALLRQARLMDPMPFVVPDSAAPPLQGGILEVFTIAFPAAAILVAAFALGDSVRNRRAHLHTLEQRAAAMQRERHQREELAAATERGRLAREMHDVVAHGLSVIVMQAQGGAAMLRQNPDLAAQALEHITVTGRAAMADMRSLLGLAQSGPRLAPQPGVGDLPALIDRIRAAGTPVVLDIDGQPPPLPTAVDLSAYRIAQEALTNVIKHAGPGAQAKVRLAFPPGRLELDITDDGVGPGAQSETGHGLRGMAERAAALGGEMSSGPGDSGGFRVRVSLPVPAIVEA